MNKFERLKSLSTPEAQKLIESLVGEELTKKFFEEEKRTVPISKVVKVGSFIKYGGLDWVVLEHSKKGVKVLSKHLLFERAFDSNNKNNWATSSLRKELNNFNAGGSCTASDNTAGIKKSDLVAFDRNLTTDDGLRDYKTCRDFVSLISCEEYRKYRDLIPNADDWWWTLTADSLKYDSYLRRVDSGGALSNDSACSGSDGVRPLCILKSDTAVEVGE